MIKEILEKAGHKVGLIGTIATYINGRMVSESSRTTPESIELQKTFAHTTNYNQPICSTNKRKY